MPLTLASVSSALDSTGFRVARDVALVVLVALWLASASWVHRDARRRIRSHVLRGIATLLGLVPVLGPILYLMFRPPERLEDVRARRIELETLEARLRPTRLQCPVCRTEVRAAFLVCPVCVTQLKEACRTCSAPLEPLWQACPHCGQRVVTPGLVADPVDLDAALAAEALRHPPASGRTSARHAEAS